MASATGTAGVQGELWSARSRDWAEAQEGQLRPLYDSALERLDVGQGMELLDVGCGAGLFCTLAAGRGARVSGIDAAEGMLAVARERVPEGDFRVGELEELPYGDDSFDVVTGFNSFQFAAHPAEALRQARRVAKPGATVLMATWGPPEECEAATYLGALGALMPPPPPGAPGPFALSAPGALESLVEEAGLTPKDAESVECVWEYPDEQTMLRGMLSAGPAIRAIGQAGEERAREAVLEAVKECRTEGGGYRIRNVFRYLTAAA